MLVSFGAMAAGFVLIFRGITVMDCTSVSFSRHFTTCYANSFGALSGPAAGGVMIAAGMVLFFGAMLRLSSIR